MSEEDTLNTIKKQIQEHSVILYMKGSPNFPNCSFSEKAVKILENYCKNFFYIDVLANPNIRSILPKFSNWPTFPQLWVNGSLIGGYDIILEMYNSGELQDLFNNIV